MKAVNASRLRVRCCHWRNPEFPSTEWLFFSEIQTPINLSLKMRCVGPTFPAFTPLVAEDRILLDGHYWPCWPALPKACQRPASVSTCPLDKCLRLTKKEAHPSLT